MRADLSVPIGGGTFRSWFALFDFAWPKEGGAEAADRGEEAPEETDGGDSHVAGAVVELQGCGEKCCLLKLGAGIPTGAGPCTYT